MTHYLPEKIPAQSSFFKAVWTKNLDPISNAGNLPISLQAPAIDDGMVFIGDNRGFFRAYELENGREVWSANDGSEFHSMPVVFNEKVIYGTVEGRVISRNAKSGEVIYNVDLGSPVETVGTIYKGKILFQLRSHQIFCLDVETGKILWGFKKSVPYLTTLQRASTPVVFNNKVYAGFADGTIGVLNIDEGVLIFETKLSDASKFLDVDVTPFFLDDKLYAGSASGNVAMIDPNSGKILRKAEFTSLRAPLVYKDQLIYGTSSGDLVFCDKNLNVLKTYKLSPNVALTSLALFKGNLVVGNLKGEVTAFSLDKEEVKTKFEFGHSYSAIFSDFVSKEDHLIVVSSRNRVFAFN